MSRTKGSRYSPGALALARVGITQGSIASRLGVSAVSVSRYLSGKLRPHPQLVAAIRTLGGPDLADEIANLLGIDQWGDPL